KTDLAFLRNTMGYSFWFLNSFYRHAKGFLGWGTDLLPAALDYIPARTVDMGPLPTGAEWVKLEVPLEKIGADGKLVDGIGFMHTGGPVTYGKTTLVDADGSETLIWGDTVALPPEKLATVTVRLAGLKPGTKVRVLFEDREIVAEDGFFRDD